MRAWIAAALRPLLLLTLAACGDSAAPEGTPSVFLVQVYVERDDSLGMGTLDEAVAATVSVSANTDDFERTGSTAGTGQVQFEGIPPGSYTVAHVATALPEGAELRGSDAQTVVATFAGDTIPTFFVYIVAPEDSAAAAGPLGE